MRDPVSRSTTVWRASRVACDTQSALLYYSCKGEEGHHFYLVDSGTLDCFVKSDDPANQRFETASVEGSEDSSTGARVLEYTAGSTKQP